MEGIDFFGLIGELVKTGTRKTTIIIGRRLVGCEAQTTRQKPVRGLSQTTSPRPFEKGSLQVRPSRLSLKKKDDVNNAQWHLYLGTLGDWNSLCARRLSSHDAEAHAKVSQTNALIHWRPQGWKAEGPATGLGRSESRCIPILVFLCGCEGGCEGNRQEERAVQFVFFFLRFVFLFKQVSYEVGFAGGA